MSDRNDFDFDDETRFDADDDFRFAGTDPSSPSGRDTLPAPEDRGARRRTNRPYTIIVSLMIAIFLVGLGAVLFLATRPRSATPVQLTSTAIVATNQSVQIALNQTETRTADNAIQTQTAAAATNTPTATMTETPTPVAVALGDSAEPASAGIGETGLEMNFATEVAFQTRQAEVVQAIYGTQVALSAQGELDDAALTAIAEENEATRAALEEQSRFAGQAVAAVETALATRAQADSDFATLVAEATPLALQTQSALATLQSAALEDGVSVAQLSTPGAGIVVLPPALSTLAAQATQGAIEIRAQLIAEAIVDAEVAGDEATASFIATALGDSFATEVAYATERAVYDQAVLATRAALESGEVVAQELTEIAAIDNATRSALQVEVALVNQAASQIELQLAIQAERGGVLATSVAAATPAAAATQVALATAFAEAPVPTEVALLPEEDTIPEPGAQDTFATQQSAILTPPVLSTAAAIATQAALAARAELIRQALLVEIANATATASAATPALSANDVALTATALALTLGAPPTQEILPTPLTVVPQITPLPTALPDTGLFDDLAVGGRDGLGILVLAAFGLLGVIVVSRRLRVANNRPPRDE